MYKSPLDFSLYAVICDNREVYLPDFAEVFGYVFFHCRYDRDGCPDDRDACPDDRDGCPDDRGFFCDNAYVFVIK